MLPSLAGHALARVPARWNLEGSVRSRGEIATALTVRDLIEAGLNKPAGSQALWG